MSTTPSTAAISIAWEDARVHLHGKRANEARAEFDQWLAFHDAAIVRTAVNEHDALVAKVAAYEEFVENARVELTPAVIRCLDAVWKNGTPIDLSPETHAAQLGDALDMIRAGLATLDTETGATS